MSWKRPFEPDAGGIGGVSDHGALTGLGGDDHPQYLTQPRGDVRYHTKEQVNGLLVAKADLVGGVVPTSQIPALAVNETFVVNSEAAMLALSAQRGDMARRTDFSPARMYVLASDTPAALADWILFESGGAVGSVNGQTGTVVLGAGDVGAAPSAHVNSRDGHPLATPTLTGMMAGADKEKLDNLSRGDRFTSYMPLDYPGGAVFYERSLINGWTELVHPKWVIGALGTPPSGTSWYMDAAGILRAFPLTSSAGLLIGLGIDAYIYATKGGASFFANAQAGAPFSYSGVPLPVGANTTGFTLYMAVFTSTAQTWRLYRDDSLAIRIYAKAD